jgi:hypothetical protein
MEAHREQQRPSTPPNEPNHPPPDHPPTRARGYSYQDIAAYRYLRKHAIGNEAERAERRLYLESQHPNLGRRMEVGETRRINSHRIVGEPAARERERQRPGTPPDEPREPDPQEGDGRKPTNAQPYTMVQQAVPKYAYTGPLGGYSNFIVYPR